ncbi:MAG TPA: hypothetical protein VE933_08370 [Chitinophagaceae bacterium]|nr:hypothetical protein [Chitinophagaceae bacterium]
MKTFIPFLSGCMFFIACQRSVPDIINRTNNTQDSVITTGDSLTYEVLTADTGGWAGTWNLPGGMACNVLDSVTYGSPIYLPSGWRYTFSVPTYSFQALLSASARSYSEDITVNLFKNGHLIKSVTNDAMKGVAKFIYDIKTDTLVGTASDPVLKYEVLVSDPDTTKFESDAWLGHWMTGKAVYDDDNNHFLQGFRFAMPSGWKYSFKPDHLPFTMKMQAGPYTIDGGKITINFFVNGQLVKSSANRDWIYDMEYTVQ